MKIVTLIENTKQHDHLFSEHGLSLYIETNGTKIVLDTGNSSRFIKNSESLGIDLKAVDYIFLSHAHADHGGGLHDLLQTNRTAAVYMHREAVHAYYGNIGAKLPMVVNAMVHPFIKRSRLLSRYIGLDNNRLRQHEKRIEYIDGTKAVDTHIVLIADIAKTFPLPEGNKFLLTQKDGTMKLDDFGHELVLVINESEELIVFTGCGHSGIINILEAVKTQFNGRPIKAVVGGFHLRLQPGKDNLAGTKEDIESIADEMDKRKIEKIYTGHCTGSKAYNILKERLKDRIAPLYTGCTIQL